MLSSTHHWIFKEPVLFYRMFQSLWSVWRAFWRDMIIIYMHIWTRNMSSAVHSIGYVKNHFLFYRMFQSLWSVWREFWRDMKIMYMHICTRNMCSAVHCIGYVKNQFLVAPHRRTTLEILVSVSKSVSRYLTNLTCN